MIYILDEAKNAECAREMLVSGDYVVPYFFNLQRLIPAIQRQDSLSVYLKAHPDAIVISRKQYEMEIQAAGDMMSVFEQKDTFENPSTVIYELRR